MKISIRYVGACILAFAALAVGSVALATTKTDSFPTIQNPLGTPNWSTTYGGLKSTAAGVVKGTGTTPQDNMSSWATTSYTFLANQTSAITFSNATNFDWPGVTVRITGTTTSATGYALYAIPESSSASLYKIVAGTIGVGTTNLIVNYTGLTLTGSHTLELDVSGTTLTSKLDGTTLGTTTDSTYSTGQPGMAYEFGGSNATQINSYTATDAAAGGGSFFNGLLTLGVARLDRMPQRLPFDVVMTSRDRARARGRSRLKQASLEKVCNV